MFEKIESPSSEFDKYDEPKLHMDRLMKARLIEFDLSIRILTPLEAAGIKTLGDLVKQSRKSLRRINRLGKLAVETLENLLEYHGMSLTK